MTAPSMKLKVLVTTAAVLGLVVIWRMTQEDPPLVDSLDTRMEKLRVTADVEALAQEAESPDIRTARRAVATMGYVGPKAVKQIRRALTDRRPAVRRQATTAYARAAGPKELAPLAEVARDDKSFRVRASAVTALGQARACSEMETLLEAMNDEDLVVRRRAARAVTLILGRRYNYDPNSSSARRLKSIDVLRKFWAKAKDVVGEYHAQTRNQRKDAPGK